MPFYSFLFTVMSVPGHALWERFALAFSERGAAAYNVPQALITRKEWRHAYASG